MYTIHVRCASKLTRGVPEVRGFSLLLSFGNINGQTNSMLRIFRPFQIYSPNIMEIHKTINIYQRFKHVHNAHTDARVTFLFNVNDVMKLTTVKSFPHNHLQRECTLCVGKSTCQKCLYTSQRQKTTRFALLQL